MKKFVTLILIFAMLLSLTACGSKKVTPAEDTTKTAKVSSATSAEAGYYRLTAEDGSKTVVNKYGDSVVGYGFDTEGNITGQDGSVAVTAANVAEYIPVQAISFTMGDQSATPGAVVSLDVTVQPADATCKDVRLSSSDERIVSVTAEKDGMATESGQATITAKSYSSNLSTTCVITVAAAETPTQETAASFSNGTHQSVSGQISQSSSGSSGQITSNQSNSSSGSGSQSNSGSNQIVTPAAPSNSGSGSSGGNSVLVDPKDVPAGVFDEGSIDCAAVIRDAENYGVNTYGWVVDKAKGGTSFDSSVTTTSYSELLNCATACIDRAYKCGNGAGTRFHIVITYADNNTYATICAA